MTPAQPPASGTTVLVTGGAGFIGSALVRHLVQDLACRVVTLDKLTYASSLESIESLEGYPLHHFVRGDIADPETVGPLLDRFRPIAVFHLAAESHVDRSIDAAAAFIETNLVGTFRLLEAVRRHWTQLRPEIRDAFRFVHVSTDEVYGSLGATGCFTEESRYDPTSPYAASKAGADHLARAWQRTYGLPLIVTHSSNNHGPWQFPDKFVPTIITKALRGQPIPVYGDGTNIRDWIHVDDHVRALVAVWQHGRVGASYNIGGGTGRTNLEVVRAVCSLLAARLPDQPAGGYERLIRFVADRPGHDFRYALDCSRIRDELGWKPRDSFETGLLRTVEWYLQNRAWWERILAEKFDGRRLGLGDGATT